MDDEKPFEGEESRCKSNTKRTAALSVLALTICASLGVGGLFLFTGERASDGNSVKIVQSSPDPTGSLGGKVSCVPEMGEDAVAESSEEASQGEAQNTPNPAGEGSGSASEPASGYQSVNEPQENAASSWQSPAPQTTAPDGSQAAQQEEASTPPPAPEPAPQPPVVPAPEPEPEVPAPPIKHICRLCNVDITGFEAAHIKDHMLAGEDASWYPA